MEKTDAASRPCRRVGTFTFGMVLVVSGLAMLVSMFFPQLEFTWLLQLSPLALISLGVETLLAARGGGRVKYDWVGMLLCFLIVCASLVLFAAAWWLVHCPDSVFY
ncbi:MAG: hypothetical protein SO072_10680 [Dysosmobacter sp.]|nr:hypothetical protein [Dysosmobacter sp.]